MNHLFEERLKEMTVSDWRKLGYVPFSFHDNESWEEYADLCFNHDEQFGWHDPKRKGCAETVSTS